MHYSLTRATLWNLASYLYLLLASLVSIPILVQGLGLEQFARYGLIVATLTLVSSLNLGLPQGVVRALLSSRIAATLRPSLWATSSLLFLGAGLLASLIALGISSFLQLPTLYYPLIFALTLLNFLVMHYLTLPHAQGHFGIYNLKAFVVGTANTFLAAYIAWRGEGILVILLAQLASSLFTLFILAIYSASYFPRPWLNHASSKIASELVSFGLKNQVGTLVGQVQAQYAKFLLSAQNPLALSAYLIAQGLVQKAAGGVVQLSSALYPASSRSSLTPRFSVLYWRLQLGLFALSLLGLLLFWLWGIAILTWWLTNPDLVILVHSVLRVMLIYLSVLILTPLPSAILDGRGRPELTSLMATLTTILEIALAFIFLPSYGILAPAYATLIAIIITTPLLLYLSRRVLQSNS